MQHLHEAPQLDDIKVEYHLRSGRPTETFRFHEYTDTRPSDDIKIPVNSEPWKPFRSRLDFELAELILDTHMNKSQSTALIALIHRCISDPQSFTLSGYSDLAKVWEQAATRATNVSQNNQITIL